MDNSQPHDTEAETVSVWAAGAGALAGRSRRRGRAGTVFLVLINLLLIAAAVWYLWFFIFGRGQPEPEPPPPPPPPPPVRTDVPAIDTPVEPPIVTPVDPPPPPPPPPMVTEVPPPVDTAQASLLSRRRRGNGEPPELAMTERVMDAIGVQAEVVWYESNAYPSSAKDYGAHRGNEALFEALVAAGRADVAGLETKDTDGDGRPEIVDGWGQPLVYFSNDDYGTEQEWAGAAVTTRRSTKHGEWHATNRFQLWSAGPDAKNESGLGDDATSWVIAD